MCVDAIESGMMDHLDATGRRDDGNWINLMRDAETGIEALQAHFDGHAYDPHFHDAHMVGVTEQGVQQFRCRGTLHNSTPGRIILIEAGEVHDGHAVDPDGFTYRALYLDVAWLQRSCDRRRMESGQRVTVDFRATLQQDPRLTEAILQAFSVIRGRELRLARDAALDRLIDLLMQVQEETSDPVRPDPVVRRLRDLLDARMTEDLGLDDLAAETGIDRFRLTRAFQAAYGLAPHAYLVQLRLTAARRYLAKGLSPAEAAAAVGFADQSHLGRWFRRAYRLTPAAYRRICTNVPDQAQPSG